MLKKLMRCQFGTRLPATRPVNRSLVGDSLCRVLSGSGPEARSPAATPTLKARNRDKVLKSRMSQSQTAERHYCAAGRIPEWGRPSIRYPRHIRRIPRQENSLRPHKRVAAETVLEVGPLGPVRPKRLGQPLRSGLVSQGLTPKLATEDHRLFGLRH